MQITELLLANPDLLGIHPDRDKLRLIYRQHAGRKALVGQMLTAVAQLQTQIAGCWLIKHHLRKQQVLSSVQTRQLLQLLEQLQTWQAQSQVLQCMQYLNIPEACQRPTEQFIRQHLSASNTFVRAWAYDAFYRLASQYPEYMPEAQQLLEMGMRDEPAAVKARIKQLTGAGQASGD